LRILRCRECHLVHLCRSALPKIAQIAWITKPWLEGKVNATEPLGKSEFTEYLKTVISNPQGKKQSL
jgi:hypothetical protein